MKKTRRRERWFQITAVRGGGGFCCPESELAEMVRKFFDGEMWSSDKKLRAAGLTIRPTRKPLGRIEDHPEFEGDWDVPS